MKYNPEIHRPVGMKYNPEIHRRRSIRLKGYDYGQLGVYCITLCTHEKQCWFGEIRDSKMCLNQLGNIVVQEWLRTPQMRPEIVLDEWIMMPNHLHGILIITDASPTSVGAHRRAPLSGHAPLSEPAPLSQKSPNQHPPNSNLSNPPQLRRHSNSLSSIIAGFKSTTTKRINVIRETPRIPLWQRNYYESVVRDTEHLEHVRNYIRANPSCWIDDPEYSHTLIDSFDLPF
jgi:REP element-mobilizing transposase RayT